MKILQIVPRALLLLVTSAWVGLGGGGGEISTARAEEAATLVVDDVMESDPLLVPLTPIIRFLPGTKELWIESLQHAEADLQRQIADSITKAHRMGIAGMSETVPALMELLEDEPAHPAVTFAAVSALAALDAREAAGTVFQHARASGGTVAQIAEPALARWRHEPAYAMWRERLTGTGVGRRALMLAIRCLAEVDDAASAEGLAKVVDDGRAGTAVRIAAAQSLASIKRAGLEPQAERLAADDSAEGMFDRLLAATLLQHHTGEQAETQLSRLAEDVEPSVVALALTRLVEIAPERIVPMAPRLVTNDDAKVRRIASQALVVVPSPDTMALLSTLLDDANPGNRQYVCRSLFELAGQEQLREPIIDAAMQVLSETGWRGLEQAALLLTYLDHKPAAGRLVELLEHARGEVIVTAAWGLRKLAVPETIPQMLAKATRESQRAAAKKPLPPDGPAHEYVDRQIAQLFQAFGELRYTAAEDVMRGHIPKHSGVGMVSRRAAIWSVGHLHENEPDEELATQFSARLRDENPFDPEDDGVRRYSAVSIGRMMAKSQLSALEKYLNDPSEIGMAARWSYERITGEALAPLETPESFYANWVLLPLDK